MLWFSNISSKDYTGASGQDAVIDTPLTDNPCNTTDNWYLTKCFVRRKLPRLSLLEYLFKNSVLSVFSGEFLQNSRLG